MVCDYCNKNLAVVLFKNGKHCCEKNISKCPSIKNKCSQLKIGKTSWNKGLKMGESRQKGKTYDEIYGERSNEIKKKISKAKKGKCNGRALTEEKEIERKRKLSDIIKERYKNGWLPKAGRCKKIKYHSEIAGDVLLDGNWELIVAQYFDEKNINWRKNKIRFSYVNLKNKNSYYTPDFYLVDDDYYIEVKGYETELDRCKWKQFPYKLIVWKKEIIKKIKYGGLF